MKKKKWCITHMIQNLLMKFNKYSLTAKKKTYVLSTLHDCALKPNW